MRRLAILLLLLMPAFAPRAQDAAAVRIFRCTDAAGRETLRDTPCPRGQAQQVREMVRPKDAPPRPAPPATPAPPPVAPAPVVVLRVPPQAMYECTTPEGKRYTSDDDDGNPRWVPLWTLGYPAARPDSILGSNIGGPPPRADHPTRPPRRDIIWPVATGGGTWIRDACARLPQQEACARLRDRRDAIRTRFFNAMPSERDVLRREERGINARLDNDCGGH